MTDSTKDMFNAVDISSLILTIGHPNGTLAKITAIGSLKLTRGIVLFDICDIPEYNVSLGTGSESGGLYLFDTYKFGECINAISNFMFVCHVSSELWQCRLGYSGDQVLSILGTKLGFSKNNQRSSYDICHKAKKTRGPFPLSDHKSKLAGDMVHYDVWKPYRVHMHAPLKSHFTAALRVLRYLKNALRTDVQFYKAKKFNLQAYSDADWAKCPKQATISRSSVEYEYRCLAFTTCELIWIVKILKDLEVDGLLPTHLYCDSSYAISIARNPVFHEKTKNFEINLDLVREKVTYGVIKVLKVASANNVADFFY
uniref:Uncharacterized protein n=1 Tax=Tanacetum cinerariifolium TaxID=118510 RepID=A0A699HM67_TANCI|nr:hypothetical protein [Tanacetum cinerariifolium]